MFPMSQPKPIFIDTNQFDNPIYITVPMPRIILQIPSVEMILAHKFGSGYHSGSNNRCTRCGHPQSEENEIDGEIDEDDIKVEVVDEDDMKKEEFEAEEIKQEIKEEMIFQYPFKEQHDFNKYILPKDENRNESPLSSLSEANTEDEIYEWEQRLVGLTRDKDLEIKSIIAYLKHGITDQDKN